MISDLHDADGADLRRPMSIRLAVAVTLLPVPFAFFTLRDGYSVKARAISLGYALISAIATTLFIIHGVAPIYRDYTSSARTMQRYADEAITTRRVIVTTPEHLTKAIIDGKRDEYGGRILVLSGTATSADHRDQNYRTVMTGPSGGRITVNTPDKWVTDGLSMGDQMTVACLTFIHVADHVELMLCRSWNGNLTSLTGGGPAEYRGVAPPTYQAPAPPAGFGAGDPPDDPEAVIDNPFSTI